MLHAEPFETHLLSAELCILFIYFLKGNCIGLEYHIILSKIHIIVIIKTKIIDKNKSCSNTDQLGFCSPFISNESSSSTINIWSSEIHFNKLKGSESTRLGYLTEDSILLTFAQDLT